VDAHYIKIPNFNHPLEFYIFHMLVPPSPCKWHLEPTVAIGRGKLNISIYWYGFIFSRLGQRKQNSL